MRRMRAFSFWHVLYVMLVVLSIAVKLNESDDWYGLVVILKDEIQLKECAISSEHHHHHHQNTQFRSDTRTKTEADRFQTIDHQLRKSDNTKIKLVNHKSILLTETFKPF